VVWLAVSRCFQTVNSIRNEAQAEGTNSETKEIFHASADSSIQRIAVAMVKLFFYLHVKFLDLRKVSRLFTQENTKYKTILRKVYTIATGLEILGIVRKTSAVAEIQLNVPLDSEAPSASFNLPSLLNTEEQVAQEQAYDRRRREFVMICAQFSETHCSHRIQEQQTPASRWASV
jgi:hypothetical protein